MRNWQEWVNLLVALFGSGFFAAFVTQFLKNCRWGNLPKVALGVGVSVLVTLAHAWVAGSVLGLIGAWGTLTAQDLIALLAPVFIGSVAYFKTLDGGKLFQALGQMIWGTPQTE
jgi:hypothetical protein